MIAALNVAATLRPCAPSTADIGRAADILAIAASTPCASLAECAAALEVPFESSACLLALVTLSAAVSSRTGLNRSEVRAEAERELRCLWQTTRRTTWRRGVALAEARRAR